MGCHEHAKEIHNMQRTVVDLGKMREILWLGGLAWKNYLRSFLGCVVWFVTRSSLTNFSCGECVTIKMNVVWHGHEEAQTNHAHTQQVALFP